MDFTPRLDILRPPQRRLWDELAAVPEEFVLYGGTAIALHFGHRESVDFDFFGSEPLDVARLVPAVPFLAGAIVKQREPNPPHDGGGSRRARVQNSARMEPRTVLGGPGIAPARSPCPGQAK